MRTSLIVWKLNSRKELHWVLKTLEYSWILLILVLFLTVYFLIDYFSKLSTIWETKKNIIFPTLSELFSTKIYFLFSNSFVFCIDSKNHFQIPNKIELLDIILNFIERLEFMYCLKYNKYYNFSSIQGIETSEMLLNA